MNRYVKLKIIMAVSWGVLSLENSLGIDRKASEPETVVKAVNRIRYLPAPGREAAMTGGRFVGSNISSLSGFEILAEIKSIPAAGWNEVSISQSKIYRWIRYEAPLGSYGNISELEFYSGDQKLTGAGFGSPGYSAPGIHWKGAFDGKETTWFNSNFPDHQFVGLDLGDLGATAHPSMVPSSGDYELPQEVKLLSSTPDAMIRYTLDGTAPGPHDGILYTCPITIQKNTTLVAVAFKEGLAPSQASFSIYRIGKEAPLKPLKTFHVGNSLTDGTGMLPTYVRTTGRLHHYGSFIVGGSTTKRIWECSQTTDRDRWVQSWGKATFPLDHFTVQPRDFDVDREVEYARKFIQIARESSPSVQPWLYGEWEEVGRDRPTDRGEVPSFQMKKVFPAPTWEEGMSAMMLYVEEVQHRLAPSDKGEKRIRVLPTALAIGKWCDMIRNGRFPGVDSGLQSFYATFLEDHVHASRAGAYLVDLTWYSAFYGESPEGKVLPVHTTLRPEQALILQRLAWDVIQNYPDCGFYVEGKEPTAPPRISIRPGEEKEIKHATLSSSTPGAWFRYTLDGTVPTRTRGLIYCGTITLRSGMSLQAIAYKSGHADSSVSLAVNSETGSADSK